MRLAIILFLLSFSSLGYTPKLGEDSHFMSEQYERSSLEKWSSQWADHFNLPVSLVKSVIFQESRWRHDALSVKGAKGLMQLLEGTARDMGKTSNESLFNPYTNIYYGCKYLRYLNDRYDGDYHTTLIGYYSGPKWADYYHKGQLKDGDFKDEIVGYSMDVLSRINYMEVVYDQKVNDKKTKEF